MNLSAIREQRAAKVADMRALLAAAEAGKRALTADEQTKFDALKAGVTDLEQQEGRAQFLADAERRMQGTPADGEHRDRAGLEGRVSLMRLLQAQVEGRALTGAEAEYHVEAERRTGRKAQGMFLPMAALETRVNTTTTGNDLVPTDHRADQFISPLRNALLARRLGVRVLSGLSGNVSIPKQATTTSVGWVAQNGAVSDTGITTDPVTMTPKHAGGVTEMSRQLIMQSSPDIEQLLRDDLAYMLAKAIDSALIIGGGSNEPTGVLATSGIQTANLATLSWANVLGMIEKAELENTMAANWLGGPKVKTKLASTLKASGIAGYLLEGGRMAELPFFNTTQVPEKAGSPNKLRLILGDWSQVLLGIWSEIDILVNPFDSTAYARGGVLVRAMSTVDIAVRHPTAFVHAEDIAL
ncbi:MAG: phage major capsid protein [Rubrivivax sp.]|nr:phage major capsid protein [Rubrivivax sp.]